MMQGDAAAGKSVPQLLASSLRRQRPQEGTLQAGPLTNNAVLEDRVGEAALWPP